MPFFNMPFSHQNIAVPSIQPAPTLTNHHNPLPRSSTPRPKKKGRWVSYEPQISK
ncbi:hypothetical protein BD560DRAFT_405911 [Blakeslea trispora]|nr:hypothetical protein BD560DRAFT_405911 [Blakeslea trispora]